jgi:hypothetical protein
VRVAGSSPVVRSHIRSGHPPTIPRIVLQERARVAVVEDPGLPPGFDYVDLGELLDVVEALVGYLRTHTYDEEPGERDVEDRAKALLDRHRSAS